MKHIWFYSNKWNNNRNELNEDSCAGSIRRSGNVFLARWVIDCCGAGRLWVELLFGVLRFHTGGVQSLIRTLKGGFLTDSTPYLTPSSCIYNKLALFGKLFFSEWEKLWKKNIYDVHTQNTPPAPHPYQIKWCKSCKMVLQNVFIMWMKNVFCFKTSQCVCLFIIFSSASKLNAIVLFHASLFLNI